MNSNPRLGYAMAVLAAVISGVAIWVNSLGVHVFRDATLYTTLKNSVAGIALLIPMLALAGRRAELARLNRRQWAGLAALALIGGSIPYVLFFEGLRQTGALTGALLNHLQFGFVALFAAVAIKERISGPMLAGLLVLLAGSLIGINLGAVRWGPGAEMVLASTVLFAAGFVLAKRLLKELSTLTVMTAKMALGSAALIAYAGAGGRLGAVTQLSTLQWDWVLLTGLILLAFTVTTFVAIRHAPVSAVMAIAMGSPLVTSLLSLSGGARPAAAPALALGVTAAGVALVLWSGGRGVVGRGEARTA